MRTLNRSATALIALVCSVVAGCGEAPRQQSGEPPPQVFELEETTIAELLADQQSGRRTARSIAEQYLARIEAARPPRPALRSVLEINPDALAIADALDAERSSRARAGPLHGIPVLIKDNIDTADRMTTTAGSLALAGSIALAGRVRRRSGCAPRAP